MINRNPCVFINAFNGTQGHGIIFVLFGFPPVVCPKTRGIFNEIFRKQVVFLLPISIFQMQRICLLLVYITFSFPPFIVYRLKWILVLQIEHVIQSKDCDVLLYDVNKRNYYFFVFSLEI